MEYIWFDLGYTLVYLDRELRYQQKLAEKGIKKTIEELDIAFHLADKYFMREHPGALGEKNNETMKHYYDVLHGYLNIEAMSLATPVSTEEVTWRPFIETIPTLKKLKQHGLGVGLISNWDHTARDVLHQTGIYPYLEDVIISSEVSIEKPDKRIFEIACEQANMAPEECLYIGDNYYDDVIGSRRVGMRSLLINRFENLGIEELGSIERIESIASLPSQLKKGRLKEISGEKE